jgi:hypothetical protein
MRRFPFKVLELKGLVSGAWFDGSERVAAYEDIEGLLNRYGQEGWEPALGLQMDSMPLTNRIVLKRRLDD